MDILLYAKVINEIFKSDNKNETDKMNVDKFISMFALKMNISESEARNIIDDIKSSSKLVWEYDNYIHEDIFNNKLGHYALQVINNELDDEIISRFIGFERYKYFNL